jgi:hypothetical protein
MRLRRLLPLLLLLLLAPAAALAQTATPTPTPAPTQAATPAPTPVPAATPTPQQQKLNDELYEAVRKGDLAAVKATLDKGADVNAKFRYGATALFKAAERGNADIVKMLIERGADVNVQDTFYRATAMTWALNKEHVEVIRALLEKSTDGAGDVLLTGTRSGNAALVRAALDKGGIKPETMTAALLAASANAERAEVADLLRKAGAQPPLEVDAATLQSYAGRYKPEQGGEIAVAIKDGKMVITVTGQPSLTMFPLDKTTFRPVDFDGIAMTFNADADGKVGSFTLKQGPTPTVYKRVEETKQPETKQP